jgi:hypothetical protein
MYFSQIICVPSSNLTQRWISSSVTGIIFHSTSNIRQASSSHDSKLPLMSHNAANNIFQILFHQITQVSPSNLYSKSFLTICVSHAKAHIAHLTSPGGNIQYLSLISPAVHHESVIATIEAKFLVSFGNNFFNQYITLKVQAHQPIVVIFIFCILFN